MMPQFVRPISAWRKPVPVIPNGVREVRNPSFVGILIEEGFLASLGMTAKRIFSSLLILENDLRERLVRCMRNTHRNTLHA